MARTAEWSTEPRSARRTTRVKLTVAGDEAAGSGLARARFESARLAIHEPLRPRTVVQILDAACELFAERFAPLFAVGFCLWLPVQFLQLVLLRTDPGVAVGTAILLHGSVSVLTAGFACVLVSATLSGKPVTAGEAFLVVLVRLPGLGLFSILTAVSQLLCFCGVGVIGLWLFSVVPAAYVIERCNMFQAIGRGVSLVASGGAFLRWVGYSILGGLMTLPFTTLEQGLAWPAVRESLRETLSTSGSSLDFAIAAIGAPYLAVGTAFLAVVQAVFYFDLRVRREGFDLEQRIGALPTSREAGR